MAAPVVRHGRFFVSVRCGGFYSADGIVYHPCREMPLDTKFHENNLVFRVVHEKVCIFAKKMGAKRGRRPHRVFINVVKRGKDANGSQINMLMIGRLRPPHTGGKSRTMGKAADGISRETDKEPR